MRKVDYKKYEGHTLGPWVFASGNSDDSGYIVSEAQVRIAIVDDSAGTIPHIDGQLLADAPDLLEACRERDELIETLWRRIASDASTIGELVGMLEGAASALKSEPTTGNRIKERLAKIKAALDTAEERNNMSDQNKTKTSDIRRALKELYETCMVVDADNELDARISGDLLDNAKAALDACNAHYDLLKALEAPTWLVWSNEHRAWWRPNQCGYTPDIATAGRYTFEEATAICDGANRFLRGGNPNEMIQPSPEWIEARRAAIAKAKGERNDD